MHYHPSIPGHSVINLSFRVYGRTYHMSRLSSEAVAEMSHSAWDRTYLLSRSKTISIILFWVYGTYDWHITQLAFLLFVTIGLNVHVRIEMLRRAPGAAVATAPFSVHICCCIIYSSSSARGDANDNTRDGTMVVHAHGFLCGRTRL
jgi:hypothetical protein